MLIGLVFSPRNDLWAETCSPSCSCKNPGGGCSSAPLTHPSRWASHGPGTWRRGTSGAGGYRSFCEKLNHMILKKFQAFKESSHNFKTIKTLNDYRKQLLEQIFRFTLGSQGLIFSTLDTVMREDLGRHFRARGDRVAQGEDPGFGVGSFGLASWLSQLCDFGQIA